MKDAIGNKIKEGDLLVWDIPKDLRNIIVRAQRVHDGGLSLGDTGQITPPVITILIDIPVEGVDRGKEAALSMFICARDPRSEALLDRVAGGGKVS